MQDFLPQDFILELFRSWFEKKNKNIVDICVGNLKTTYFQEEIHKKFFIEFKKQYSLEERLPSVGTMKVAFRKNRDMLEFINDVRDAELVDGDVVIKGLETFIRQCKFIEIFNKSSELYNKGDRDAAYKIFSKGNEEFQNFSLSNGLYSRVFRDFPKRHAERITQHNRNFDKMPTGIDELDYRLNGGPERGEFMLFLAESKRGKSFLLSHMGVNYARRGFGVYHLQVEGTKKQCLTRYDANWSGSIYHEIKSGELSEEKYKSYHKILENIGRGEIYVDAPEKFNSLSIPQIRRRILDLKRTQQVEVVIIDYFDLINPDDNRYTPNEERLRQRKIGQALKELAMDLDVLVLTATQTSLVSRELTEDSEFVITREHLGEDKGKVQAVDYLITLNQTTEEKNNKVMRLYQEATRDYEGGAVIFIKTNLARGRFYDRKKTLNEFFEIPE